MTESSRGRHISIYLNQQQDKIYEQIHHVLQDNHLLAKDTPSEVIKTCFHLLNQDLIQPALTDQISIQALQEMHLQQSLNRSINDDETDQQKIERKLHFIDENIQEMQALLESLYKDTVPDTDYSIQVMQSHTNKTSLEYLIHQRVKEIVQADIQQKTETSRHKRGGYDG